MIGYFRATYVFREQVLKCQINEEEKKKKKKKKRNVNENTKKKLPSKMILSIVISVSLTGLTFKNTHT